MNGWSRWRVASFNLQYLWEVWRAIGFRATVRGPLKRWIRKTIGR